MYRNNNEIKPTNGNQIKFIIHNMTNIIVPSK